MDSRFDKMDSRFDRVEADIQGLKNDVLRIENDIGKKADLALDGYQQVYEKLQEHDHRFDNLENKLQSRM